MGTLPKKIIKKVTKKVAADKITSIEIDIADNGYIVSLEFGNTKDWRRDRVICVGRDAVLALVEDTLNNL